MDDKNLRIESGKLGMSRTEISLGRDRQKFGLKKKPAMQSVLIKPNCIPLAPQIPGKLFLHYQGLLFAHWFSIEVFIQAWAQVAAIFLNDVSGKLVPFFIYISRLMLLQPLLRGLTGHTYIQAFKHSIKLRIGGPELAVFGEHPL